MFKKILIAVAGRGLCEEMVNMLVELPSIKQAEVTVLHVVPQQANSDVMAVKLEEGGKILAKAVGALKIDPQKINPILRQGDPKNVVLQVADEEKSDLIIMGSRALGRLRAILENSVSQYVFQLSSLPLLLVKDEIYVKRINRIMVAVDGSDAANESLRLALSFLSEIPGGKLLLAHINPDAKINSAEEDPILKAATERAKQAGVSYTCVMGRGNAGAEICRIAEDNNIDLLVLGSPDRRPSVAKGLPDLDRLLGSSLSDYVRVNVNCPVLLTRTVG